MLAPRLMPETTRSGLKSSTPVTAMCTQSVGVPLTEKNPFGARRTVRGRSSVSELEEPERSRSGAKTVTSPNRPKASASSVMRFLFTLSRSASTATGRHIRHLVALRRWARPLELAEERLTYHVLESEKPAAAL